MYQQGNLQMARTEHDSSKADSVWELAQSDAHKNFCVS